MPRPGVLNPSLTGQIKHLVSRHPACETPHGYENLVAKFPGPWESCESDSMALHIGSSEQGSMGPVARLGGSSTGLQVHWGVVPKPDIGYLPGPQAKSLSISGLDK